MYKAKLGLISLTIAAVFSTTSQAEVQIAIAGPTTGAVAQYGDMQIVGAMAAIDNLNASGGILGEPVEGVIYDDACDPKQAVAVANKIVNDGIQYVIGHLCSSSTEPASDVYEEEGVLMITAASTSPSISERGYEMIFRTIGSDNQQAPVAAKYIVEQVKPERIAIIHDKQQYGEGLASSVRDELAKAGIEPVIYEGVTAGDKEFSALIAKLQKNDIDFVYYGGYHPELGLILRQSREKGFNVKFMGPEGVGNTDLSKIAGAATEGLLVTLPRAFDQNPENKAIIDAIIAKDQDPTGAFVLTAYSAMQIMAAAMEATGSTDPIEVVEYIHNNSFTTPTGELSFKENGDLEAFEFVVYNWHPDGSKTLVE